MTAPTPEQYLESVMPSRQEVDAFVEEVPPGRLSRNGGVRYHPGLGWLRTTAIRPDGIDGSRSFYAYGADGARRIVNCPEQQCRIHTFGDSFTHCDQVNDGETWQEYLAAHLHEPIRNYGIGGYSVFQAYLRMQAVDATHQASHIILNIYDHDHYRNLFNLWSINYGQRVECGFTCPHLRINVEANQVEERPNLLARAEDVYQLCDRDWVIETFRNDPILPVALARRFPEHATAQAVKRVTENFGISEGRVRGLEPLAAINQLAQQAALFATQYVLRQVEEFVKKTGKKLFILQTNCHPYVRDFLEGKSRWDQSFVDFLQGRGCPVFDMRDGYAAEYAGHKQSADSFLKKYYNGHHSPAGNFLVAAMLKDRIVNWLDPKPAPYQPHSNDPLVHPDGWQKANQAWQSSR